MIKRKKEKKKALGTEIFLFTLGVFLTMFLFTFLHGEQTINSIKTTGVLNEKNIKGDIYNIINTLYFAKIPQIEKTYLRILIESAIKKYHDPFGSQYIIYNGALNKAINASEVIDSLMNGYVGKNRWQIVVYQGSGINKVNVTYGSKEVPEKHYTEKIQIPDVENKINYIEIIVW